MIDSAKYFLSFLFSDREIIPRQMGRGEIGKELSGMVHKIDCGFVAAWLTTSLSKCG